MTSTSITQTRSVLMILITQVMMPCIEIQSRTRPSTSDARLNRLAGGDPSIPLSTQATSICIVGTRVAPSTSPGTVLIDMSTTERATESASLRIVCTLAQRELGPTAKF